MEIQIEKEIQARIDFKLSELLCVIKNKAIAKWHLAFNTMSVKEQIQYECLKDLEGMLRKEIDMPIPYDAMSERKQRLAKNKAVDKLIDLFKLKEDRNYQHKVSRIVSIIENLQRES